MPYDVTKSREDVGVLADEVAKLRASYEAIERSTLQNSMNKLVEIETRMRGIYRDLQESPQEPATPSPEPPAP